MSNLPLAEQWHKAALEHADAEAAAQMLEETKSAVLAEAVASRIKLDPKTSIARAETDVKASHEWHDFITEMVEARKHANRMRVEKEYLRMRFSQWISEDANHRAGARIA